MLSPLIVIQHKITKWCMYYDIILFANMTEMQQN